MDARKQPKLSVSDAWVHLWAVQSAGLAKGGWCCVLTAMSTMQIAPDASGHSPQAMPEYEEAQAEVEVA